MSSCSVYLFGYPHGTFGHVVKVGISNNVFSRLATIQSHNPDSVVPHFHFNFPSRDLAYAIEQEFHRRFSHRCIRGEWLSLQENEALYLLSIAVVRHLSTRYTGDQLREMRKACGLLRAFNILDEQPDADQAVWADAWHVTEEPA